MSNKHDGPLVQMSSGILSDPLKLYPGRDSMHRPLLAVFTVVDDALQFRVYGDTFDDIDVKIPLTWCDDYELALWRNHNGLVGACIVALCLEGEQPSLAFPLIAATPEGYLIRTASDGEHGLLH